MITQDRIELNERFVVVFALLEEQGHIVKNDRSGRGMGDFAEKILGNRTYGHIIRAYLNPNDKRVISYSQARTLCREYNISESYMLDGIGSPLQFSPSVSSNNTPSSSSNIDSERIIFTSFSAFAGFASDVGKTIKQNDLEYFNLPGLTTKGLIAFPIEGNSMEPIINDGDIVICKPVESLKKISDNAIYAVKSNGSVWIKYVRPIPDEKGHIRQLKLISANHLEHDPFIEDVNERTQLYLVIRRISNL